MNGINLQPIETAPKDTWIIVYAPEEGKKYHECVGVSKFYPDSGNWAYFNEDQTEVNPTHWMPLPIQPADIIKKTYIVRLNGSDYSIHVTDFIVTYAPDHVDWMIGKGIGMVKKWVFDRGGETLNKPE